MINFIPQSCSDGVELARVSQKIFNDDFDEPRRNKIIVVRQRFRNLF